MPARDSPPSEIVVASYNVHGFVSRRGRFDPAATVRVIESLRADVIALQEVHRLPASIAAVERCAGRGGYELILGPTLDRDGGDFGNALLSRLPVREVDRLDLSVPGREPRGALDVRLGLDEADIRVVAVHLGLDAAERRMQIDRLSRHLESGGDAGALQLLIGDWNEWDPTARRLAPLAGRVGRFSRRATFPARAPLLALDRIAVLPAGALVEVRAVTEPPARMASDHLPLRARLRLPDPVDR